VSIRNAEKGRRQQYPSRGAVLRFAIWSLEEGHTRTVVKNVVKKLRGGGYVDVENSECLFQDI
jgi:hypothetical protein